MFLVDNDAIGTTQLESRAYFIPLISASMRSYMDYCFSSLHCKISSDVSDTMTMMRLMSSTVIIFCSLGLLAFEFFHDVGFVGETFLLLDVFASSRGFLGGVTSPCFFLSSSPSFSHLSTSSTPPLLGEFDAIFSDALFISCTSSFLFFLLLLGAPYSS
jgi:hypothetical protein